MSNAHTDMYVSIYIFKYMYHIHIIVYKYIISVNARYTRAMIVVTIVMDDGMLLKYIRQCVRRRSIIKA